MGLFVQEYMAKFRCGLTYSLGLFVLADEREGGKSSSLLSCAMPMLGSICFPSWYLPQQHILYLRLYVAPPVPLLSLGYMPQPLEPWSDETQFGCLQGIGLTTGPQPWQEILLEKSMIIVRKLAAASSHRHITVIHFL